MSQIFLAIPNGGRFWYVLADGPLICALLQWGEMKRRVKHHKTMRKQRKARRQHQPR